MPAAAPGTGVINPNAKPVPVPISDSGPNDNKAPAKTTSQIQVAIQAPPVAAGSGTSTSGGTSGWAAVPKNEPLSNAPFDARGNRIILGASSVATGSMSSTATPGVPQFNCFFRYNPSEIDTSYAFDPTALMNIIPQTGDDASDSQLGNTGLLQNQTLSFNLFFDRTYELWSGPNAPDMQTAVNGGPGRFGVLWDVWSIERLCGVYGQAQSFGKYKSGPPAASTVTISFGGGDFPGWPHGPPWAGQSGAMVFNGWMSEMSVQYTRFDAHMVPSRCAVALSFQLYYQNFSSPAAGNSTPPTSDTANAGETPTATTTPSTTAPGSTTAPAGGGSTGTLTPTGLIWPFGTKQASPPVQPGATLVTPMFNRVDSGWDIQSTPGCKVYAIAPGTIGKANADTGGFGDDYPYQQLDADIGGPTTMLYYGHTHVLPALIGQHVNAGQQIAVTNTTDPQNGSAAPAGWLEIGFAQNGQGSVPDNAFNGSTPTSAGLQMKALLINAMPLAGNT